MAGSVLDGIFQLVPICKMMLIFFQASHALVFQDSISAHASVVCAPIPMVRVYIPLFIYFFFVEVQHNRSFLLLHVVIFLHAIFSFSSLLPTKEVVGMIIVLCL